MKRHPLQILLCGILCLCLTSQVWATDASRLDPGDVVFKIGVSGILFAKRVIVVRVDLARNEVKVRDAETGDTYWTNAKNLYTKTERNRDIMWRTVKGVDQGFKNIEAGKQRQNATYSAPKKYTPPRTKTYAANARVTPATRAPKKTTAPTYLGPKKTTTPPPQRTYTFKTDPKQRRLMIHNHCHRPVEMLFHFKNRDSKLQLVLHKLKAYQKKFLVTESGQTAYPQNGLIWYTADTQDGTYSWMNIPGKESYSRIMNGKARTMIDYIPSANVDGDYQLILECRNLK